MLKKKYLRFCEFLWQEMQRDLQQQPVTGWNLCPTLGPIYLLEEKLVREGRKPRDQATLSTGATVPVDGHFMLIVGSGRPYAATRAWGWKHRFLEVKLAALESAKVEAEGQSIAQHSGSASSAVATSSAAEAAGAGEGGSGAESGVPAGAADIEQGIAEASLPDVDEEERREQQATVTPEVVEECQQLATASPHYDDLVADEVATLVSLGLRPSLTKDGYLTCMFCRNRRRREIKFQGFREVREHFQQNHGEKEAENAEEAAAETVDREPMEPVAEGRKKHGGHLRKEEPSKGCKKIGKGRKPD